MVANEELLNPILRELDVMYYENKIITADEAEDLSNCLLWIIGKNLNESNVQHVVNQLRGFKNYIDESAVSKVIKNFKAICGARMQ